LQKPKQKSDYQYIFPSRQQIFGRSYFVRALIGTGNYDISHESTGARDEYSVENLKLIRQHHKNCKTHPKGEKIISNGRFSLSNIILARYF
jgi:hypothetical protein